MGLDTYISEILGVGVSILLFFLGYRKTIGARKERAASANRDIEAILVRRLVQENRLPTKDEISRVLDTKARDFRVRTSQLLADIQFINNAFTRVLESDFISIEQREKLLGSLSEWLERADDKSIEEDAFEKAPPSADTPKMATTIVALAIAVAASVVGALVSAFLEIRENLDNLQNVLPMLAATAGASMGILSFIVLLSRVRDRLQEEPKQSNPIAEGIRLEREVLRAARRAGHKPRIADHRSGLQGYDFQIERKGRKVLVEVKNWGGYVPTVFLERSIARLRDAMDQEDASEALLITRKTLKKLVPHQEDERIKILSLGKFGAYLRSNR